MSLALLTSLVLSVLPASSGPPSGTIFTGRERNTKVSAPRLEDAESKVDGALTEAQWEKAAVLTGFSQYFPRDGTGATDSTQVLVWYSPTAIHFGIRAYEAHGAPRATLADRDRINDDDRVELLLGTFNDGRQATVLAVNPLGVQMDGTLVETNQARGGGSGSTITTREFPDLTPDFVFQSKGHLTDYGYEVEVRVPFKSLKYSGDPKQTWSLNVVRRIQHAGEEDTWAPARQADASFLGQSGAIVGLTDLRRGLVVDLSPEVTSRTVGAPIAPGAPGWHYERQDPNVGGNVRWGISSNFTLNATANPDFSQVESDAGQVVYDPRQALFFGEKRPFFLDGNEYFATPKSLVYTRRIVQPIGAMKFTGKVSGTSIGILSAVDDRPGPGIDRPIFNIARVQRDLAGHSRLGFTYTDRMHGGASNRVASLDARHVFSGIYSVQGQFAQSFTRANRDASISAAPLWNAVASRNGKHFVFRYAIDAVSENFRTQSGFIGRGGTTIALFDQRYTHFFSQGKFFETITYNPLLYWTWRYRDLAHGRDGIEKKLHNRVAVSARGGWTADFTLMTEVFGFDSAYYSNYRVVRGVGDTTALRGKAIANRDFALSLGTPRWQHVTASAYYLWGNDENFAEWSPARIIFANYDLEVRPTDRMRVGATYIKQGYLRRSDNSAVGDYRIPRLRLEYQVARPLFVRLIGEYDTGFQDALRDDSRTNAPLFVNGRPSPRQTTSTFRGDFLLSYRPIPGTVLFLGYGAGYEDRRVDAEQFAFPRSLAFRGLGRTDDALYLKASYLFRM